MARLHELLNISNYVRDLDRKYDSYLSSLLVLVIIYANMIIGVMSNENGAIYICFFKS